MLGRYNRCPAYRLRELESAVEDKDVVAKLDRVMLRPISSTPPRGIIRTTPGAGGGIFAAVETRPRSVGVACVGLPPRGFMGRAGRCESGRPRRNGLLFGPVGRGPFGPVELFGICPGMPGRCGGRGYWGRRCCGRPPGIGELVPPGVCGVSILIVLMIRIE